MSLEGKSWSLTTGETGDFIDTPKTVANFFEEIEAVCKKHGYSISHEDRHGAFIVEKFSSDNIGWLKDASLNL